VPSKVRRFFKRTRESYERRFKSNEYLTPVIGSHGASKHVEIIAFPTAEKAEQFIRQDLDCQSVVGLIGSIPNGFEEVECKNNEEEAKVVFAVDAKSLSTRSSSIPLECVSFVYGNICFAMDKERHGLPWSICRVCDVLIHVPHSPISGPMPLLNTPTCMSIVLDTFMRSVSYAENSFQGQKFAVSRPCNKYMGECKVVDGFLSKQDISPVDDLFDEVTWASGPGNHLKGDY
jgi:hypothetical protein